MSEKKLTTRIQQKMDTKANWDKATNFVPLKGEYIYYSDLHKVKVGDGVTKVGSLPFLADSGGTVTSVTIKMNGVSNTITTSGTIDLGGTYLKGEDIKDLFYLASSATNEFYGYRKGSILNGIEIKTGSYSVSGLKGYGTKHFDITFLFTHNAPDTEHIKLLVTSGCSTFVLPCVDGLSTTGATIRIKNTELSTSSGEIYWVAIQIW